VVAPLARLEYAIPIRVKALQPALAENHVDSDQAFPTANLGLGRWASPAVMQFLSCVDALR
jgi:hypothetical protein